MEDVVEVDVERLAARRRGQEVTLSRSAMAVLEALGTASGRVVPRAELARQAGLTGRDPRRCDSVLVDLRRALGDGVILTVRSRGWRCAVPIRFDPPV